MNNSTKSRKAEVIHARAELVQTSAVALVLLKHVLKITRSLCITLNWIKSISCTPQALNAIASI